jgi:hypothetical protein
VSFGLTVLAMRRSATPEQAREMVGQCHRLDHVEGDLDPRIVAFHEDIGRRFPNDGSLGDQTPWADAFYPGIDHVHLYLRFGAVSDPAIDVILELAAAYGLVLYDPQGDEVHLPDDDSSQE